MNNDSETRSVTLSDIALALGTTKTTVSYALNGKGRMSAATRQAILDTAREMGFQPNPHAQRLTTGRCTDTVALFTLDFDLGVGTRKLQLLQRALASRGFRSPVHVCGTRGVAPAQSPNYQAEAMSNLRRQKPLGIICNIARLDDEALEELDVYRREGGFVVCYDHKVNLDCDQVIFDREENTYCATRHLLEKGHRDIALYGVSCTPNPDRFLGFKRAMKEFGVPLRKELFLQPAERTVAHSNGDVYFEDIGKNLVEPFLALRPRPSAICIADDVIAAAFVAEAMRRGVRVPDDVSVVGHDDLPMASVVSAVPLSTVSQPVDEITNAVIEMMMERIEGQWRGEARHRVLYGRLIERDSVTTRQ